jgi:hypothetical protein
MVIFHSYVSLPEGIYITVTNIIKYMNDIAYIINFIINAEFIIYIYTCITHFIMMEPVSAINYDIM